MTPTEASMIPTVFETLAEQGYAPEIIEDSSASIEPLNGKYVARISSCERVKGEKDGKKYDFYSTKFTVTKTVEGTKGENRRLQRTFSLTDSEWSTGAENVKKFCNMLFTILGHDFACTAEGIQEACEETQGKLCRLSVWPNKRDGVVQVDNQGWPKHNVKVIAEFKKNGKVVPVDLADTEEEVPF